MPKTVAQKTKKNISPCNWNILTERGYPQEDICLEIRNK